MLNVSNVTKRFGGLVAVSSVDLEVNEKEIVSLIGPNGAGKTTLFAMVAGFLKADEGRVDFENASVLGMRPHQICQLGMVRTFQITQPFAGLTTLQNIMVGAYSNTSETDRARTKAEEVAETPKAEAVAETPKAEEDKAAEAARLEAEEDTKAASAEAAR